MRYWRATEATSSSCWRATSRARTPPQRAAGSPTSCRRGWPSRSRRRGELQSAASVGLSPVPRRTPDGAEELAPSTPTVAMYQSKGRGRAAWAALPTGVTREPLRASRPLHPPAAGDRPRGWSSALHYQPIVWTASRPPALIWRRCCGGRTPTGGSWMPDEFIPAAEEMGLLEPIGAWVISEAIRGPDHRVAGRQGIEAAGGRSTVSARAAPARLRGRAGGAPAHGRRSHPSLCSRWSSPSPPPCASPSGSGPACSPTCARSGLRLAIDDFGAGWSSLFAPARAAPCRLAEDRPLVPARGSPGGPRRRGAIVRAVHRVVGTRPRHDDRRGGRQPSRSSQHFLAAQGCPLSQGQLFGAALPPAAMTQRLLDERD